MSLSGISKYTVAGLLALTAPFVGATQMTLPAVTDSVPLSGADFDTSTSNPPNPLVLDQFNNAQPLSSATFDFIGSAEFMVDIVPNIAREASFLAGTSVTMSLDLVLDGPRNSNPINRSFTLSHTFDLSGLICQDDLFCRGNNYFQLTGSLSGQFLDQIIGAADLGLFEGAGTVTFDVKATRNQITTNDPNPTQFIVPGGDGVYKAGATMNIVYTYDDGGDNDQP